MDGQIDEYMRRWMVKGEKKGRETVTMRADM